MFITINELPVAAVPVGAAGENFLDFYLFLMIFNYFFCDFGTKRPVLSLRRISSFRFVPAQTYRTFRSVLEEEPKWRL